MPHEQIHREGESGQGEQPQHLYSVRFDARALWGPDAETRGVVCVDLFESYLEKA